MRTRHIQHTFNGKEIVALQEDGVIVTNAREFHDLIFNLPSDRIVLYKENIDESFFDLRTGFAGEILQETLSHSKKLGIIGDYSRYASRSLNAFISEGGDETQIVFADSLDEALRKLSA
ncbi:MAG: DUF4180 domain-containing protein [Chryseolinea sp.]